MPNITDTREAFFARYKVEPCQYCLKRAIPGTGIGPVVGQMMLDLYITAEADRLKRLIDKAGPEAPAHQRIQPDAWDETLRTRNHALYIRACWMLDMLPEQAANAQDIHTQKRTIAQTDGAIAGSDEPANDASVVTTVEASIAPTVEPLPSHNTDPAYAEFINQDQAA